MKALFRIFIIFVSITLLIIIFRKVDIYRFLEVFINLKLKYYITGISVILSTQFLFAYRWKLTILNGKNLTYSSLLYRTVTSYFFNNLFLGVFGGDFYKAVRIRKNTGRFFALFSVVFNRIINTCAAMIIPFLLIPFVRDDFNKNPFLYYSAIISGILFFGFILFYLLRQKITDIISKKFKNIPNIEMINEISLPKTLLVSLLIQFINISAHFFYAVSLGISIDFFNLAVLYSVSAILLSIPVSINGIGVREGIFIFAFGFWGIPAESALAFSLLSFSSLILFSIIGGSIFVGENIFKVFRSENKPSKDLD